MLGRWNRFRRAAPHVLTRESLGKHVTRDDGKRVSAKTVASHALCERSDKGVGSEGGNGSGARSPPRRRLRAEGRFDCYLQYFRKVYINKGDLISEWLLEASREPFWTLWEPFWGVQWRSCSILLLSRGPLGLS